MCTVCIGVMLSPVCLSLGRFRVLTESTARYMPHRQYISRQACSSSGGLTRAAGRTPVA